MSLLDDLQEGGWWWGAVTLPTNQKHKPGKYQRRESPIQSRLKWFGGQSRKNGGTGRCPPDRKDHARHRLWSRLGTRNGHKMPLRFNRKKG